MQCENCNAELSPGSIVCSECGAPITQNIEGFENTKPIQRILKLIIVENGRDVPADTTKLIAFMNDYLSEYDKERRLLIYTLNSGVLKNMFAEKDHSIAVMRAKSCLISECFISENAVEFVIACLTYMLKWPYESDLRVKESEEEEQTHESEEKEEDKKDDEKAKPLNIDSKVFRPIDAVRYRLSRNVNIPEGYSKIEGFCFDGYGFMHSIKLPSSLLAIGEYAFSGCKHLSAVELPESLKIIRQGAFSQCIGLATIKIPTGILEIEDNTFLCCESLEVVEIPSTVSSIGAQAFSGCEKLKMLFLPESVKFIDENAFLYCPELTIRCYENSYVHKYCLNNEIKVETVVVGADLRDNLVKEG